ncbi:MAG: cation transporter [Actinomycetaceae bacterium]|nr:cation transporter [Actinomycetaceae bacterium]
MKHQHNSHTHHHHTHHHTHTKASAPHLLAGLIILSLFIILEVIIAFSSGSLALLSDAGHMLSDAGALALALWISHISSRPANTTFTYGFRRAEVLSGMANALTMLIVGIFVSIEAIKRFFTPHNVSSLPVIATALAGIIVNILVAWILARADRNNLNIRGAYQHILTDLYGFIGTAIAGIIILTTGWVYADSIASLIVATLMIRSAWLIIKDAGLILLETSPSHISPNVIREHLLECKNVQEIHDLHVWTLSNTEPIVTAHIVLANDVTIEDEHDILDQLQTCLSDHFSITHSTFQCELPHHSEHEEGLHH